MERADNEAVDTSGESRAQTSSIDDLRRGLEALLRAIEDDEAYVYTAEEWRRQGQPYGNDAVLTIMSVGPLGHILNHYADSELIEGALTKYLDARGYFFELGFAWSIHIYRDDLYQDDPTRSSGT